MPVDIRIANATIPGNADCFKKYSPEIRQWFNGKVQVKGETGSLSALIGTIQRRVEIYKNHTKGIFILKSGK